MNCRDAAGYLRDLTGKSDEPEDRPEFEEHLAECQNCREFVREYDMTGDVVRAAYAADSPTPPDAMPRGFVDSVLADLRGGGSEG